MKRAVQSGLEMGLEEGLAFERELQAELFASSLVADLHLIPAFVYFEVYGETKTAIALAIGAIVANIFSMIIVAIEASKIKEEF